jgi:hypothetical protein
MRQPDWLLHYPFVTRRAVIQVTGASLMAFNLSPGLMRHFARLVFATFVTIAAFSLLIAPSAQAKKKPSAKVEICHFKDSKVKLYFVSEDSLEDHLAHGDDYPIVDGSCDFQPETFCIQADLGNFETKYYEAGYLPSTGEVTGVDFCVAGLDLTGSIRPIGFPDYSIFSSPSTFQFTVNDGTTLDLSGAGVSTDDTGEFLGTWQSGGSVSSDGAATYAFFDNICPTDSCDCAPEWTGQYCGADIDECTLGTDNCDANAACSNTVGSFSCDCNAGYSGDGLTCTGTLCAANESVTGNVCTACADGTTNAAGDDASSDDTLCEATLCAADDHVSEHTCVACDPGYTNDAGDDPSGANTSCTDIDECTVGTALEVCSSKYATCTNTPGSYDCQYEPAVVETFDPTRVYISFSEHVTLKGVRLGTDLADIESIWFGSGHLQCVNFVWVSEEEIRCETLPGVLEDVGEWPILVTTYSHTRVGTSRSEMEVFECPELDRDCAGVCYGASIPDDCGECGGDESSC